MCGIHENLAGSTILYCFELDVVALTVALIVGPLSAYPQRIKRTNVRYVRGKPGADLCDCIPMSWLHTGSLLFSKPQTEACTTTADIVKVKTLSLTYWVIGVCCIYAVALDYHQIQGKSMKLFIFLILESSYFSVHDYYSILEFL